jgi:hypothetical protein
MARAMNPRDVAPLSEQLTEKLPADAAPGPPAAQPERAKRHERITQAWLRSLGAVSRHGPRDDRPA